MRTFTVAKLAGIFIIDDIRYPDGREHKDIIGGAGTYAALGCRLFPRNLSNLEYITHVVHKGKDDLPSKTLDELRSWDTRLVLVEAANGHTNRGLNTYVDKEGRLFEHVHQPHNRLEVSDIHGELASGDVYHLICSPNRCKAFRETINDRDDPPFSSYVCRKALRGRLRTGKDPTSKCSDSSPFIIWEPNEGDCRPDTLAMFRKILDDVDIFSPNLAELGGLYDVNIDLDDGGTGYQRLRAGCRDLLDSARHKRVVLVIRLGDKGCYIFYMLPETYECREHLIPACKPKTAVDVTGAGNAFLGGFAYGLFQKPVNASVSKLETAALFGTVAASFAIEQVGMPKLGSLSLDETKSELATETWNDNFPFDRYKKHAIAYLDSLRTLHGPGTIGRQEGLEHGTPSDDDSIMTNP